MSFFFLEVAFFLVAEIAFNEVAVSNVSSSRAGADDTDGRVFNESSFFFEVAFFFLLAEIAVNEAAVSNASSSGAGADDTAFNA